MHDSQRFQRRLTARILALLGAACLVAPEAGCHGAGAHGTSTATGGAPRGSGGTSTVGTGGAPSTSGSTSTGGATATGGGATGGGGGGVAVAPTKVCMAWPLDVDGGTGGGAVDAGACPADQALVLALFESIGCPRGFEPSMIVAGPVASPAGECCYECQLRLCGPGGRPYLDGGQALVATLDERGGAGGWREGAPPRLDDLTAEERAQLAAAWTRDALLEHASVASFSRAALGLLAAGAPAELLALTHQAALDEVRHARLCFTLASAYAGEARDPGRFPLGGSVAVPATLAEIAASVVEEGCVGETVAAMVAAEQLARAADPAVRAALARIADDEARHAELAWRTAAWAVEIGGPEVRAAVARVFFAALRAAQEGPAGEAAEAPAPLLEAARLHGRLDGATVARVTAMAMAAVVAPAAWTLLRLSAPARVGMSAASSLPV